MFSSLVYVLLYGWCGVDGDALVLVFWAEVLSYLFVLCLFIRFPGFRWLVVWGFAKCLVLRLRLWSLWFWICVFCWMFACVLCICGGCCFAFGF